jgi:hypothetical protein
LNPAVDPAEESDFAELLSAFTALLSEVEAVDWELFQPEINPMTIKPIKMAANRFMYYFLFEERRFRPAKFVILRCKKLGFFRMAGKSFTHLEVPETKKFPEQMKKMITGID